MKTILSGLVLVCTFLVCAALAHGHAPGYVNSHGYRWDGQYWVWPATGYQYTLTYSQEPYTYYSCGRAYTGYYQQPYYQRYYPPAPPVPAYDPNQSFDANVAALIGVAKQRDSYVLKGQLMRAQTNLYGELVDTLGMRGNFRLEGYGLPGFPLGASHPPAYANPQIGSYGVQGNTLFGYGSSYQTLSDVYGDGAVGVLYQQAARLTQNAQDLGGRANDGFQGLIAAQGERMAKYAEIQAKARAFAESWKAMEENRLRIETKKTEILTTPGAIPAPNGQGPESKAPNLLSKADFYIMAQNYCGKCHDSKVAKGNFDLGNYFKEKDRVQPYLTRQKGGCPQDDSGSKVALPPEVLQQFLNQLNAKD